MTSYWGLPSEDVAASVEASAPDLVKWAGARVLVTGGTGVLGSWLLAALVTANDALDLGITTSIVTRSAANVPDDLAERTDVEVLEADVANFSSRESFDLVIHGAAGASTIYGTCDAEPRWMASTTIDGTRRLLECAATNGARLVFLSSGAVYGPQIAPVAETARGGPDPLDARSAYGESKRLAELYCAAASAAGEVDAVIARLFAFVGPRIPLDSYYAAGNFMRDLIAGDAINVDGDGRPRRSYLYCADVAEWCFAIATRGSQGHAYNVGSPEAITIAELADAVAALVEPNARVVIHTPPTKGAAPWYVPIIEKSEIELGLRPRVGLEDGLRRWLEWLV